MKKYIRLLTRSDVTAYTQLLQSSYANAVGFIARPEALLWYEGYEKFPKLGLFHDHQLLSTMEMHVLADLSQLNFYLNSEYQSFSHPFPIACLTKAATKIEYANHGLSLLLRYYLLKIAIHWGVSCIVGTMVKGSPRIFTMENMGYSMTTNPKKWNSYFISQNEPLIAVLDLATNSEQALNYIIKSKSGLIGEYQIEFNIQDIKIPL